MSKKNNVKASKFLSLVLRHKPQTIGLTLDENGWANVGELIEKAKPRFQFTSALIEEIVANNDKQRFALSEDKSRIRANQGHSLSIDIGLEPQTPPDLLLHGTATRFLESIQREGLRPGTRQHVHLSVDRETALAVGRRYGKPALLEINAKAMHTSGHEFLLSNNGVWLTDRVPAEFISSEIEEDEVDS